MAKPIKGLELHYPMIQLLITCVIHRLGGPYREKLCPRSSVLKEEGTVFPYTDQPKPVNNIVFFFLFMFLSEDERELSLQSP